jgi:hypothetical protein
MAAQSCTYTQQVFVFARFSLSQHTCVQRPKSWAIIMDDPSWRKVCSSSGMMIAAFAQQACLTQQQSPQQAKNCQNVLPHVVVTSFFSCLYQSIIVRQH